MLSRGNAFTTHRLADTAETRDLSAPFSSLQVNFPKWNVSLLSPKAQTSRLAHREKGSPMLRKGKGNITSAALPSRGLGCDEKGTEGGGGLRLRAEMG